MEKYSASQYYKLAIRKKQIIIIYILIKTYLFFFSINCRFISKNKAAFYSTFAANMRKVDKTIKNTLYLDISSHMRKLLQTLSILGILLCFCSNSKADLAITIVDQGGTQPGNAVGGGNLVDIAQAAATYWEDIFAADGGPTHNLAVGVRWGARPGSTLATHTLLSQSGTPNRETVGSIEFDNDTTSVFFLDSTPNESSEYTIFNSDESDLGGGILNTGRYLTGATGFAAGRTDLFTVALHEIGHALGISSANISFTVGDPIVIGTPLPFEGTVIETDGSSAHLDDVYTNALLGGTILSGRRIFPSDIDILVNAQISQYDNVNLQPVPEPSSLILLVCSGMISIVGSGRFLSNKSE